MMQIEPELTSSQVYTLKEKYPNETKEDARKRVTRYAKAFQQYDENFKEYSSGLKEKTKLFARTAAKSVEAYSQEQDQEALAEIASAMTTSLPHTSHAA